MSDLFRKPYINRTYNFVTIHILDNLSNINKYWHLNYKIQLQQPNGQRRIEDELQG